MFALERLSYLKLYLIITLLNHIFVISTICKGTAKPCCSSEKEARLQDLGAYLLVRFTRVKKNINTRQNIIKQ